MTFLWRLLGVVPASERRGLTLPTEVALRVRYSGDHRDLLRAVQAALPRDCVVYIESPKGRELRNLLASHPAPATHKIYPGTIWPKDVSYHVPNDRDVIDLIIRMTDHALSYEVADHIVVYHGECVLVTAYDLGDKEVELDRTMDASRLHHFLRVIGANADEV